MLKNIKDPIHGWIKLDPLLVAVMDTPQVQRLRRVKQLALVEYVFPGASHNRLAHSIGVAYLGGEMMRTLRASQPELGISEREIVLVELAGLCHDLGHGPFSHAFDYEVLPRLPNSDLPKDHEDRSREILKYVVKNYNISIDNEELNMVLEMIHPSKEPGTRKFLYEIIANSISGVDVDKFDYLMRDTYYLGWKTCFDAMAFVRNVRVIDGHICYPDWLVSELQQMFMTRYHLHKAVYNNNVVKAIEYMASDALVLADSVFEFSRRPDDWILHTDSILDTIRESKDDTLSEARHILRRMDERNLYKCIFQDVLPLNRKPRLPYVNHNDIVQDIRQGFVSGRSGHPMPKVFFYNSKNPNRKFNVNLNKISRILDTCHQERLVRVFIRNKRSLVPSLFTGNIVDISKNMAEELINREDIVENDINTAILEKPTVMFNQYLGICESSIMNSLCGRIYLYRADIFKQHKEQFVNGMKHWNDMYRVWMKKCAWANEFVEGRIIHWIDCHFVKKVNEYCEPPSELAFDFIEHKKFELIVGYLDSINCSDEEHEELSNCSEMLKILCIFWELCIKNKEFLLNNCEETINDLLMASIKQLVCDRFD